MTQVTIDTFTQDFKKTSYYTTIFNNPGIIMAYVGGSRLIKADSLMSDFDVVIITDSTTLIEDTGIRFRYKDMFTVHFYYHTIDQFLSNTYTRSSRLFGPMQAYVLDRSALIYENPHYNGLITRFFKRKAALGRISMLKYAKHYSELLTEVSNTNTLVPEHYHKYLYHLCYCYFHIAKLVPDLQLLLQAKYSASGYLTEPSLTKLIEILKNLKHIVDFYTMEDLVAQFEPNRQYVLNGSAYE